MTKPKPTKRVRKPPTKPRKSRRIDPNINQQGKGGGRKTIVFTAAQVVEVEKLSAMLTVEQMGDYFGVGQTTMFEIFNRQPEVAEAYHKGRARVIGAIAQNLIQKALGGDYKSQELYLCTKGGWKKNAAVDVTSSDGSMSPTRIEIVAPSVHRAN